MNMGQDKNIDEGLKMSLHLPEASTPTEAPTVFTHSQFGELRTVEISGGTMVCRKRCGYCVGVFRYFWGFEKARRCSR